MSEVLRIGIVGSGIFGQMHLKAFTQLQNEGKAELAAIADIVREKREKAAQEYGVKPYEDYREMIGTDGIFEIDSQDRGAGGCLKGKTQQSYNLGFYAEKHSPDGKIQYGGYGIESIMEFAYHVNYVLNGDNVRDLDGLYADAHDGFEVSKICVGIHKSIETNGEVINLDTL